MITERELLKLDDALSRLAEVDERAARVVELRAFGGMTAEETAHVLGVSDRTVRDDWRVANMWLSHQMTKEEDFEGRQ